MGGPIDYAALALAVVVVVVVVVGGGGGGGGGDDGGDGGDGGGVHTISGEENIMPRGSRRHRCTSTNGRV